MLSEDRSKDELVASFQVLLLCNKYVYFCKTFNRYAITNDMKTPMMLISKSTNRLADYGAVSYVHVVCEQDAPNIRRQANYQNSKPSI